MWMPQERNFQIVMFQKHSLKFQFFYDTKLKFIDSLLERILQSKIRGVAQMASALGSGPRGRRFKSVRPDQFYILSVSYGAGRRFPRHDSL